MHIKRLSDFAHGGECTGCQIVEHPSKPGMYLLKHSSKKELTAGDRAMIIQALEQCKAEHQDFNANEIVALIDGDLANIS